MSEKEPSVGTARKSSIKTWISWRPVRLATGAATVAAVVAAVMVAAAVEVDFVVDFARVEGFGADATGVATTPRIDAPTNVAAANSAVRVKNSCSRKRRVVVAVAVLVVVVAELLRATGGRCALRVVEGDVGDGDKVP
jgi:hypothetical protein